MTRFAFRNPNGITYGYATFDLLLQNSSITKLCFVIPAERGDEESQQYREMGDLSHSSPLGGELRFEMTCTRMNSLRCTTRDLPLQRLLEFNKLFNLLNKNAIIFVNLLNSGYICVVTYQ